MKRVKIISALLATSILISSLFAVPANAETQTVPVSITVSGIAIEVTLPISINFDIRAEKMSPTASVSKDFNIINETRAGDGSIVPVKVTYGTLTKYPSSLVDDKNKVETDTLSSTRNFALGIKQNSGSEIFVKPNGEKKIAIVNSELLTLNLYSSPAFKYGTLTADEANFSLVFTISLY